MKKIVTVIGARPQFVKAAVLSKLLAGHPDFKEVVIHTGQHYDKDMSDVFFSELGVTFPDYFLNINGLSHGAMTGKMVDEVEKVLIAEAPDLVIVYGDTNSTLAGALAAVKLNIPIAHVEAGLRSFNRRMPEEINRILTDHMSTLHFCSTSTSIENLSKEGISQHVYHVGDIMYDATLFAKQRIAQQQNDKAPYALLTIHREESTNSPDTLLEILKFVYDYAKKHDLDVILPIHPRLQKTFNNIAREYSRLILVPPQGYFDFHQLVAHANVVLTDSGGLQKEAYFHRVPCITLRSETEWVETIDCGWNRLWKHNSDYLPRREIGEYGVGQTGEKIIQLIAEYCDSRAVSTLENAAS